MTAILSALRDGRFVTDDRARRIAWMLVAAFAAALAVLFATAHGDCDYAGRPLGSDFSSFYAAGRLALAGANPYDQAALHHLQQALFGARTPFYAFAYPPFFLFLAAPLAMLPYLCALALWQLLTLALYLLALRRLLRHSAAPALAHHRLWLPAALGFGAVFLNLTHGQTGFLAAALFARALSEAPGGWRAGFFLGLAAFKPQFGLAVPIALIAGGHWRALLAGAATLGAGALLATLWLGAGIWPAFLAAMSFTRQTVLEDGATGFYKMQSLFAWVRLLGGPLPIAYAAQGLLMLLTGVGLARIWRTHAARAHKGAALVLATLLTTPYALDYDLMLLAPAIALLAAEAKARGPRPFALTRLALLWALPLAARPIAQAVPLLPMLPLMGWSFAALWRDAERR